MWTLLIFSLAVSLELDLRPKQELCLHEDLITFTLVVGMISTHNEPTLSVSVLNPLGQKINSSENSSHFMFSYTAFEDGKHSICLTNTGQKDTISVLVEISIGVEAKDYSKVASTQDLKEFELKMRKNLEQTKMIHQKIQHLREREEQLRNTNQTIHSRVIGYSVSTLVLLAGLAVVQILYLKNFFKAKKMI